MLKLSFSSLGCPDWSWSDMLSVAVDMGYQGIEVRGVGKELHAPHISVFRPQHREATIAELTRLGLGVVCLTSACELGVREQLSANEREIPEYIELAAALGTPYIRVVGSLQLPQEAPVDQGLVLELLQRFGAQAAARGVTLLLETNGCYADSERLAKTIDAAGQGVKALWDIQHPFRFAGEGPEQTVGTLGKRIAHVHIKDSVMADGRLLYRMPGRGELPVEGSVNALRKDGYDGFYSLEWLKRWDWSLEDAGVVFAQYVPYMRATFES